jgi:hypothetical protein
MRQLGGLRQGHRAGLRQHHRAYHQVARLKRLPPNPKGPTKRPEPACSALQQYSTQTPAAPRFACNSLTGQGKQPLRNQNWRDCARHALLCRAHGPRSGGPTTGAAPRTDQPVTCTSNTPGRDYPNHSLNSLDSPSAGAQGGSREAEQAAKVHCQATSGSLPSPPGWVRPIS